MLPPQISRTEADHASQALQTLQALPAPAGLPFQPTNQVGRSLYLPTVTCGAPVVCGDPPESLQYWRASSAPALVRRWSEENLWQDLRQNHQASTLTITQPLGTGMAETLYTTCSPS